MKIAIAGGGISGLATAYLVHAARPDVQLTVFEASERCGGKAWTDHCGNGYLCEWGVNGFLDNKPLTLELCRTLGLEPLAASGLAKKRYVYRRSRMNLLPESPGSFLRSGLLSLPGRLRVMCEAFIPRGANADESLQDFATRRLGREGFEALIDPMASGVFAGDPARMSLSSCFPRIHELETRYGSLIRAMVRLQVEARKAGRKNLPGAGPGGTLTSFSGGISDLIGRLETELSTRVRKNTAVQGLSRTGNRYCLQLGDGSSEEFDAVVLALPAWAQAGLLSELAPGAGKLMGEIPYPPLSVVCLAYRDQDLTGAVDGFGFLVPSGERKNILGTVIDSNVFSNRAPPGKSLLRIMVGGSRAPEKALFDDDKLLDLVRADLRDMAGVTAEPEFARIYRHEQAIPQYHVGHAQRLAMLKQELEPFNGLYLAGNALRGVSLNDCVANAYRIAARFDGQADN